MPQIIKPPHSIPFLGDKLSIFLAGSIEQGNAINWQELFENADYGEALDEKLVILNPRRDHWDATLQQSINPIFKGQVEWELTALDIADYIVMYFDPNTKSPISLLELGLYANSKKLLVYCPEGFWRKGNVDIVCERYGIEQFDNIDDLIDVLICKLYCDEKK